MNEPNDKILHTLEPPPGGLARLVARRDASRARSTPSWWALAAGGATAAIVWMAVLPAPAEIRMRMTGSRLIGEPSQGVSVKVLEGGRAVPLASNTAEVRIYWVEPAESAGDAGK